MDGPVRNHRNERRSTSNDAASDSGQLLDSSAPHNEISFRYMSSVDTLTQANRQ